MTGPWLELRLMVKPDTEKILFAADLAGTLLYATAAIAGSALMVMGGRLGLSARWAAVLGGVGCFALRLLSVWRHWSLPKIGSL